MPGEAAAAVVLKRCADAERDGDTILALIKGAPAGELAKRACDHLLSKDAQTELLLAAYRRPSRSDIDVSKLVQLPAMVVRQLFAPSDALNPLTSVLLTLALCALFHIWAEKPFMSKRQQALNDKVLER